MQIYIKYLNYVVRHKWFVMLECFKMGMFWRGIIHDMSKFRPSEFIPYARYFYGDIKKGRDGTGYYKPVNTGDSAFDMAWLLHQKRNDHHWQYWVLIEDDNGIAAPHVFDIPFSALKEMLCDWKGAGKAQGTPDTKKWYLTNRDKITMHKRSRLYIELWLGIED